MAENKMSEVAKLLGVELDEEFGLENSDFLYKFTKRGLRKRYFTEEEWRCSNMLDDLLLGKVEIVKKSKPILDEVEQKYISAIIKPFRSKVKYITKNRKDNLEYEYISIAYRDNGGGCALNFPDFRTGTMYRNMIISSPYKLEELGL